MSLFGSRLKHVNGRVWDTSQSGFDFPELAHSEVSNRPNTGICISGGGTRSASCAVGQLRALWHLGLLPNVRYLSTVSGGAWTSIPFNYLPNDWNDETFLGMVMPPGDLTEGHLKNLDRNSFLHAISDSVIVDDFLSNAARLAGDETFSRALGDLYLERFGLDSLKRLYSFNHQTVEDALQRNTAARADDFYVQRGGRPYLIVGGTVLRTQNQAPLPDKVQIEMTPLYTGIFPVHADAGANGQHIGGGYLESFAFDSDAPDRGPGGSGDVTVRLGARRHRFTLSDVMGTTGAAPAEILDRLGLDWLGFPEFKYWPVAKASGRRFVAREYEFGDGGLLENLGLMPLLLRRVEKIIMFVNTKDPLKGPDDLNDSIPPLFGHRFPTNQIFPKNRYKRLVDGLLKKKRAGETVMHQDKYRVQDNPFYGIKGGWEVEILWVYNERVSTFEQALKPEIRSMIGQGSLGNFPHYRTFFQNPPAVIDLSAKQTSLLAHLSCWNVTENEKAIRSFLR